MKSIILLAGLRGIVASNPLGTVINLLDELTAKITKDGEVEAKAYNEYVEWCDDTSKNAGFAIKTASTKKAELEAKIGELSSDVSVASSRIEELAATISTAEAELKDAKDVRDKENSDFLSSEKELMEAIDALSRATSILEKEMAKNPAAFAQIDTKSAASTIQAISSVLDAVSISSSDRSKLTALVQAQQNSDGEDDAPGAPAAATYKTHSTNILDVLEDLKEKAESQLSELRKAEVNTQHNYNLLAQSLKDQAATDSKDMDAEKSAKASAEEDKATAEGDLKRTSKDLATSNDDLSTARSTCIQVAADHEATVAARKEELAVIAQAKTILSDTSSGAVSQTYSFMETSADTRSRMNLAGMEVIAAVKRLAKQQHSAALAQLASRIAAVARYGSSAGESPFVKIKGLIQSMIEKLEGEAASEATEKAYCDEQIAKTEFKKGELEDDIAKMTSKIDQSAAKSTKLKAEVQDLESELAALMKSQAEMDKIRQETHADYSTAKADLELGLSGVRKALSLLREYYGNAASSSMLQDSEAAPTPPETHEKSSGAGGSIINILEVVESDFATNLAKEESQEADAQAEYEKVSQENAVTKTLKDQDVKYKTQEAKSLDATVAEYSSDRQQASTELTAVLDYYAKIKERCIAKPETYEARQERRQAEIQGLKQALSILENETAFVQRRHRRGFLGRLAAA